MDFYNALIQVAVIAIPAVLAITLHEAAHGYVARHFGDPTAYLHGRLTLNPIKHIDPVGTIAFPLLTSVMGGIIFGWAKPVPVNFMNLRRGHLEIPARSANDSGSRLRRVVGRPAGERNRISGRDRQAILIARAGKDLLIGSQKVKKSLTDFAA
jgi:hypothetical protein